MMDLFHLFDKSLNEVKNQAFLALYNPIKRKTKASFNWL